MKGVVASGHPLTAGAAKEMFSRGGNAFDAVVSAGFSSVVSEPALTSLGGGGFLLTHAETQKEDVLFDFFVNTPGLNSKEQVKPEMLPVEIIFPQCSQIFHTGLASAAVPGMLKGLLHVHKRLCTLPLKTILSPAMSYLEQGIEVCATQEVILGYLERIYTTTDYGRQIYMVDDHYVKLKDRLFNPLLKEFFQGLADNGLSIYSGERAQSLIKEIKRHHGLITADDLASYQVIERKPLRIRYRDREVLTNPPPSSGGIMFALALHLLDKVDTGKLPRDSGSFYITLIELMKEMNTFRPMNNGKSVPYPFPDEILSPLIESYLENVSEKTFIATEGTTHISIIDGKGNAASMTTSNGSGSGCFIPGTGIMLNNMMGEDDLHPEGFFSTPPGRRVSSMMIPTMVMKDGKVECVLGSGGSKRIRTAVLQVLINVIDYHYSLKEAVEKSRVHIEDGIVQAEPGISGDVLGSLKKHYVVNNWNQRNMYFGGVHSVSSSMDGWGDSRRGGSVLSR
jgi:gamma-glutamyltranspeptidase/glutathione hydrolase